MVFIYKSLAILLNVGKKSHRRKNHEKKVTDLGRKKSHKVTTSQLLFGINIIILFISCNFFSLTFFSCDLFFRPPYCYEIKADEKVRSEDPVI